MYDGSRGWYLIKCFFGEKRELLTVIQWVSLHGLDEKTETETGSGPRQAPCCDQQTNEPS